MDDVSSIRKSALSKAFLDALTKGGPGGIPRPIEMHAHDSLRYIGDMLAWIHQCSASENEMLEMLFCISKNARYSTEDINLVLFNQESKTVKEALENHLEGVCRQLKSRIESVLLSEQQAVMLYKSSNMILFYDSIIVKITGLSSTLHHLLEELQSLSMRSFYENLNQQANILVSQQIMPERDLLPLSMQQDCLLQLREILLSYQGSMNQCDSSLTDIDKIITIFLDPLKQSCSKISQQLEPLESAIFTTNCYYAIQSILNIFSFTGVHIQEIEMLIDMQIDILVKEQVNFFLNNEKHKNILKQSGLASLVQHFEYNKKAKIHLASDSKTNIEIVKEAIQHLDSFLSSMTTDIATSLQRVTSAKTVKRVCKRGLVRFLETYKKLYDEIKDPNNGYANAIKLRKVSEMETILSLTNL